MADITFSRRDDKERQGPAVGCYQSDNCILYMGEYCRVVVRALLFLMNLYKRPRPSPYHTPLFQSPYGKLPTPIPSFQKSLFIRSCNDSVFAGLWHGTRLMQSQCKIYGMRYDTARHHKPVYVSMLDNRNIYKE